MGEQRPLNAGDDSSSCDNPADDLDRVRTLVEGGADPGCARRDERVNKTPLDWAEAGGHAEVVDYLRSIAGTST